MKTRRHTKEKGMNYESLFAGWSSRQKENVGRVDRKTIEISLMLSNVNKKLWWLKKLDEFLRKNESFDFARIFVRLSKIISIWR